MLSYFWHRDEYYTDYFTDKSTTSVSSVRYCNYQSLTVQALPVKIMVALPAPLRVMMSLLHRVCFAWLIRIRIRL